MGQELSKHKVFVKQLKEALKTWGVKVKSNGFLSFLTLLRKPVRGIHKKEALIKEVGIGLEMLWEIIIERLAQIKFLLQLCLLESRKGTFRTYNK